MATKEEVRKIIIDAVQERIGPLRPCALCGQTKWILSDKFATIPVQVSPAGMVLGGESFPTVPLLCGHCGNTHFLNLLILGLKGLDALKADDDESAPK